MNPIAPLEWRGPMKSAKRGADLDQAAAGALQRMAAQPRHGDLQVEHDRLVVRRAEIERAGEGAGDAVGEAAVETKGHDVAAEVRRLSRTDIGEAGDHARADRVVVADDCRRLAAQ